MLKFAFQNKSFGFKGETGWAGGPERGGTGAGVQVGGRERLRRQRRKDGRRASDMGTVMGTDQ